MIYNGVTAQAIGENANTVLAGATSGGAAIPRYRALVPADLPALSGFGPAATNAQLPNGLSNFNSAVQSQLTVNGTKYYVTSSNINVPASPVNGFVIGTTINWRLILTKDANAATAFSIIIFRGTNGTSADTADVTQSIGTPSAAVDTMEVDVQLVFTAVGASGSYFWSITPIHQAATTAGFGISVTTGAFTGTVSSVNTTTANLKFGLGFVSTNGSFNPTITVPSVQAEAYNLD